MSKNAARRLLIFIDSLPDQDLKALIDYFSKPQGGLNFAASLRFAIERRGGRKKNQRVRQHRSEQPPTSRLPQEADSIVSNRPEDLDRFETALRSFLLDQTVFASTREVVDFLNSVFDWDLKYADFQKKPREELFHTSCVRLRRLSLTERRRKLENFYRNLRPRFSEGEGYRELFKFLTGT